MALVNETPQWKALEAHWKQMSEVRMRDLFAADPGRAARMSRRAPNLFVDFSKNIATDETLRLLLDLAPGGGFTVAGVGHVNHALRGASSDRDEEFCRRLASGLGLPFESARRDVSALARANRTSIEAAAREARYEALAEMAGRLGADLTATGHTRDDQAETVLSAAKSPASARYTDVETTWSIDVPAATSRDFNSSSTCVA